MCVVVDDFEVVEWTGFGCLCLGGQMDAVVEDVEPMELNEGEVVVVFLFPSRLELLWGLFGEGGRIWKVVNFI